MTLMEDSATPAAAITNTDILDTDVYTMLASIDPPILLAQMELVPTSLLYVPLHHLFKLCLCHCSIPSEWNIHPITPIFKAVSTTTGHVSLLCYISKVLELDKIIGFVTALISVFPFEF